MQRDNLAYRNDYEYRERETRETSHSRDINRMKTIRTTGGVMMKAVQKKLNTAVNEQPHQKKSVRKGTVLSVVVITAMAFLVLFRGLMITKGYEKLEEKKAMLSATIAENQKLEYKINQALDMKNIENIAQNTFNMGQPTKGQTVYINLDNTDEVKKVRGGNSVLDAIKNFFSGIVEYFA